MSLGLAWPTVAALSVSLSVGTAALDGGSMRQVGRGTVNWQGEQVRVEDAYLLLNDSEMRDFSFSFEGRAPENAGAEEVGIWATFRQLDRHHRYVVGVRGAPHSDIYLARYSPDGNDRMLALQPVPTVAPGEWATVRVIARGSQIKVSLNDGEPVVVEDPKAPFAAGKVGVGGGYHPSEYRNFRLSALAEAAANEPPAPSFVDGAVKINFQPAADTAPEGWRSDSGLEYTPARGHGWSKPLGSRNRRKSGQFLNDTLVTIAHETTSARFRLDLDPGEYLITLQHGDTYDSALNVDYAEGSKSLKDRAPAGEYRQRQVQATVGGEGLLLEFNRNPTGAGTSLNWLVAEPREKLSEARWVQGRPGGEVSVEKEALRQQQRAVYQPVMVPPIGPGRSEVSLDGDWLFLPDYEFANSAAPETMDADDAGWHVMHVPDLWSPYSAWLFGETFPDLPYDKGASDSYFEYRHARVEAFTFDWNKTRSAWYRKHVLLPEIPDGKRFELHFDAIAKVAHVYVNGTFVGKNYGMFGEVGIDVTDHVKPGSNVIAVKVDPERNDIEDGDEIVDVAISVEVTRKMLSALPYGMTRQDARGIWQPTKLVITDSVRITDVFVKPRLDGADVEVTVKNMGDTPVGLIPNLVVTREADGVKLVTLAGEAATVPAHTWKQITLAFSDVSPRLWSPDDPQLYTFEVDLNAGNRTVDALSVVSGFRTFEARGNRLYLNGRPYVLRGANHCPNMLAPNDRALADQFMQILRENNLNATRFHALPGTTPWMEAADRNGVLISYEGTWPWLMLRGPIPPQESLEIWMDEFERVIRKYRNHPSLMLWTVNNEMKFHVFHAHQPDRTPEEDADALARWRVVSDAVKRIRETDPTRPVVADSCYLRKEHWRLSQSPEALGIDDGDIDDRHGYYNWYNESFFHLLDRKDGAGSPDRPYIGQELSTGYYNGDSGHPVRAYLFAHQTPQSWVGQWAYEHQDPDIFLTRHAMLTKELAEYFRRERREDWAGSLIFGLATWFREPWDAERIAPYPVVTDSLHNAMAPVLVSARLTGRNVFAGEEFTVPVSIINDAENGRALPAGTLNWRFAVDGETLSNGSVPVSGVDYYTNRKLEVKLTAPDRVPGGRADAQLHLELVVGGNLISHNHYAMRVGGKEWAIQPTTTSDGRVMLFNASDLTRKLFQTMEVRTDDASSLNRVRLGARDRLVIDGNLSDADVDALRTILASGSGRVVWIHPQEQAGSVFPEQVLSYRDQDGEVVTMLVPESPVFDGVEIGDLAWMGGPSVRRVPVSSLGGYHVAWKNAALTVLAEEMKAHGYLKDPADKLKSWVAPLVLIHRKGGVPVILSEMSVEAALTDPLALRLWANLVSEF
jgi:hypothetical protein